MKKKFPALVIALAASLTPASAITILWDYTYDTNGFFTQERREVLNLVSHELSHLMIDSPDLPYPTGAGAYWNWLYNDPSTGMSVSTPGDLIGGSITIFLGARDLGSNTLGLGGPAGSEAAAANSWVQTYVSLNTDEAFKPFAGTISFTTSSSYNWYSGLDADVPVGQFDFFSVALHELGHVLGIGTGRNAWTANTEDGFFIGANAQAVYGGPVPLNSAGDHVNTSIDGYSSIMNPTLGSGNRYYWGELETAMLLDLGYVAVPEAESYFLFGLGITALAFHSRRRRVA